MVKKKRTGSGSTGESSGEAPGAPGHGSSQRAERGPQQHGGGRGWVPQHGGRGGGQYQGRGGHYQGRGGQGSHHPGGGPPEYQGRGGPGSHHPGGGPPDYQGRGGSGSHHPGGGPPEYQPRDYQGRGGPRPRGGMPQPYYGGPRGSGGRSVPSGSSRTVPELHQASQDQYQATVVAPSPSRTGPSSLPVEASSEEVQHQFQELAIQGQSPTSQAIQPAPPSSKSVRFPMRPGKGTFGDRCIVKANHFFAELPDKDLHQYDVRSCLCVALLYLYI